MMLHRKIVILIMVVGGGVTILWGLLKIHSHPLNFVKQFIDDPREGEKTTKNWTLDLFHVTNSFSCY